MEKKDDILKKYETKKEELNLLTNELLGLYRNLLEEKIDYKKENKYSRPISGQRVKINTIAAEIKGLEKQIKRSDIKKIEKKIRTQKKKGKE